MIFKFSAQVQGWLDVATHLRWLLTGRALDKVSNLSYNLPESILLDQQAGKETRCILWASGFPGGACSTLLVKPNAVLFTKDLDILANRYRTTNFAAHDKAAGPDALRFFDAWKHCWTMHQDLLHLPVFAYMRMHMHEQSYSEKTFSSKTH